MLFVLLLPLMLVNKDYHIRLKRGTTPVVTSMSEKSAQP